MNVSICALNSDLQRHKPLKVFQSYKVTRITKREEEELLVGFFLFSGGNDQSVFIIAGHLIIVINYLLPAGHWRRPRGCGMTSGLSW